MADITTTLVETRGFSFSCIPDMIEIMQTQIQIKLGKDLTVKELEAINEYRLKEFKSKTLINPRKDNENWKAQFFLLYTDEYVLKAFGKLSDIQIALNPTGDRVSRPVGSRVYDVPCISTIIATEKGCGFGKQLVQGMIEYVKKTGKTAIGFCETGLLGFYEKCGFGIAPAIDNHFVYQDKEGNVLPNIVPGEVIYVSGSDDLMDKILTSQEQVGVFRRS